MEKGCVSLPLLLDASPTTWPKIDSQNTWLNDGMSETERSYKYRMGPKSVLKL